jgi:hypothetical protein
VLALREFASTVKDQVDNLYSRAVMRRSNVPANAWKARAGRRTRNGNVARAHTASAPSSDVACARLVASGAGIPDMAQWGLWPGAQRRGRRSARTAASIHPQTARRPVLYWFSGEPPSTACTPGSL